MRAEKYHAYLGTLESISQTANLELQTRVFNAWPGRLAEILAKPDAADSVLVEMAADFSKLLSRLSDALAKASDGLLGLKLVSSPEVLRMLEEYVSLQHQLYQDAMSMAVTFSQSDPDRYLPRPTTETIARGERANELLQLIIRQMRKELGADK